MLHLLINISFT